MPYFQGSGTLLGYSDWVVLPFVLLVHLWIFSSTCQIFMVGEKKPVFTLKFYGVWIALSSAKSMKAGDSHLQHVKCNHITFLTFFNVPLLASCSMSRQVDASVIPGLGSSACQCHQSSFSSRRFFLLAFPPLSSSATKPRGRRNIIIGQRQRAVL